MICSSSVVMGVAVGICDGVGELAGRVAVEDGGEVSAAEVTTEVVGLAVVVVVGFIVDESNTAVAVESDSDIVGSSL